MREPSLWDDAGNTWTNSCPSMFLYLNLLGAPSLPHHSFPHYNSAYISYILDFWRRFWGDSSSLLEALEILLSHQHYPFTGHVFNWAPTVCQIVHYAKWRRTSFLSCQWSQYLKNREGDVGRGLEKWMGAHWVLAMKRHLWCCGL